MMGRYSTRPTLYVERAQQTSEYTKGCCECFPGTTARINSPKPIFPPKIQIPHSCPQAKCTNSTAQTAATHISLDDDLVQLPCDGQQSSMKRNIPSSHPGRLRPFTTIRDIVPEAIFPDAPLITWRKKNMRDSDAFASNINPLDADVLHCTGVTKQEN